MKPAQQSRKLTWAKHQKRWFGKWHLYLGIIAGAIVSFVGVTGSILVFQDEIDRVLNRDVYEVNAGKKKMPIEEIVPLIRQKYPELKIEYLNLGRVEDPAEAYSIMNFKENKETFINPYTGAISGKRMYTSTFIRVVTELHRTLLVPVIGRYIAGLASLCLLILTISGLRLWIPKKWKQLKSVLSVRFSGTFGFYSAPVVSILSLTGFCITFSPLVIALLFILNGESPQGVAQLLGAKSAWHEQARPLPLKDILATSRKLMPEGSVQGIAFPEDRTGSYRLDIKSGNLPRTGQREMLIVDQYTGEAKLNSRKDFPNSGNAYLSWLTPIHFGSFGGRPTQIIALIGGLMPLVLFITGFIIWWPRFKKQRKKKGGIEGERSDARSATEQKNKIETVASLQPAIGRYFINHFKSGFKYAGIVLSTSFLMGALYGLLSGIVLQPAVFVIAFSAILVVMSFVCALLAAVFNLLFRMPFRKGSYSITKYFALSLAFTVTYLTVYMLLLNTGLNIF